MTKKSFILTIVFILLSLTACDSVEFHVDKIHLSEVEFSNTFRIYIDSDTKHGFESDFDMSLVEKLAELENLYETSLGSPTTFISDNELHEFINAFQPPMNYYKRVVEVLGESGNDVLHNNSAVELVGADTKNNFTSRLYAVVTDGRSPETHDLISQLWENYNAVSIYAFKSLYRGVIRNSENLSEKVDLSNSYVDSYYFVIIFGDFESIFNFDKIFVQKTIAYNRVVNGMRIKTVRADSPKAINNSEISRVGNSRKKVITNGGENFENMALYRMYRNNPNLTLSFNINDLLVDNSNYNYHATLERYSDTNNFERVEGVEYEIEITTNEGIISVMIDGYDLSTNLYRVTYTVYEYGTLSEIKNFVNGQQDEYNQAISFGKASESVINVLNETIRNRSELLAWNGNSIIGFYNWSQRSDYIDYTETMLNHIQKNLIINQTINFGTLPLSQANSLLDIIIGIENDAPSIEILEYVFYVHVVEG